MRILACVSRARRGGPSRWLMVLFLVCVMMTVLGCATLDIKMDQDVSQSPCQGCATTTVNCPVVTCPPVIPPISHGELVIQEPVLAAWVPFNNTFTDANVEPGEVWYGAMIQLGAYDPPGDFFHRVSIDGNDFCIPDSPQCGQPGQPGLQPAKWINIVPAGESGPMTLDDIKWLFPAAPARPSFHDDFTPKAVITYWMGEDGYEIAVTADRFLPLQTFRFQNAVDVYVYLESTVDAAIAAAVAIEDADTSGVGNIAAAGYVKFSNVELVHVLEAPGTDHGSHNDPPMGPRR